VSGADVERPRLVGPRRGRRALLLVLALAAVIRFGYVLRYHPGISYESRPFLDETDYDALAVNLLRFGRFAVFTEGHLAQGTRPPGYPVLLAALYGAFGHRLLVARLANAALGVLAVGLSYALVRRLTAGLRWSASAALAAAAVHALSGLPVLSEARLTGEELGIVLVLGLALTLSNGRAGEALRRRGRGALPVLRLLAAAALGIALIHVRPAFLVLTPVIAGAAYLSLRGRAGRGRSALGAVALAGMMAVGSVPWLVRSKVVLGRVVPISSVSGWHLLASSRSLDGLPTDALRRYAYGYPGKSEGELFWQGTHQALTTMDGRPLTCIGAGLVRLWRSWGFPRWYERFWRASAYVVPVSFASSAGSPGRPARPWLPLIDFEGLVYLAVLFACWSVVSGRWRRTPWGGWWSRCGPQIVLVAGYAGVHALAVPFVQYRLYVEPVLVACGVVAVGWVLHPEKPGPPHTSRTTGASPVPGRRWFGGRRAVVCLVGVAVLGAGWWWAYRQRWGGEGLAAVKRAEARAYFASNQPEALRLWERDEPLTFGEVRAYQYEHGGAVDGLVGRWVLWSGELGYCGPGFRYSPAHPGREGEVPCLKLAREPGRSSGSVVRLVVGRDPARGLFGLGDVRVHVRRELPVNLNEHPGAVLARVRGTDLFGGVVLEATDVLLR